MIGESASITSPGNIPANRQSAARMNIAESEYRSTSWAVSAAVLRGRPRKVTPNALTKHAAAKAAAKASSAPTAGTIIFRAHCGELGTLQYGLEDQPLRHEAVEWRKRRDGDAADQKDEAGERHPMDEAAQFVHVPLARRRQHGTGPEKQQTLEERVIENVEQCRRESERRRQLHAVGLERQRKAEANENDADILYRAVGEQALEVLFHHGVQNPHDGGDAAKEEHDHARRPGRRSQQSRIRRG